jgi:hypothetical protein
LNAGKGATMQVSIRMIGIATTFFWIFLIIFSVSAFYSVKDLQFAFGEPQMSLTSDNELLFSLPITIANHGYYDIGFFKIMTEILDDEGFIIMQGSTLVPIIVKDEKVVITHNMTIDVDDMLESSQSYLFNDSDLKIYAMVGMRLAELIPVQASTNLSMPWGAPLYNFVLGEAQYEPYNLTHFSVTVPISFENHAFFDLAGTILVRMYNNTGSLLGRGTTNIETVQHSPYNGLIRFYVSTVGITESGHFEVYFQTPLFKYGPLVIPYG